MIRLTGGSARGRRISVHTGPGLRPTSDKVRQALFNLLAHRFSVQLSTLSVLDLFAGAGSLGLEAISRGAQHCTFIERDRRAVATLRASCEALSFESKTKVICAPVERALGRLAAEQASPQAGASTRREWSPPYGLIFADPPYRDDQSDAVMEKLLRCASQLTEDALLIFESATRNAPEPSKGWLLEERRGYGDTTISFFCRDPSAGVNAKPEYSES